MRSGRALRGSQILPGTWEWLGLEQENGEGDLRHRAGLGRSPLHCRGPRPSLLLKIPSSHPQSSFCPSCQTTVWLPLFCLAFPEDGLALQGSGQWEKDTFGEGPAPALLLNGHGTLD